MRKRSKILTALLLALSMLTLTACGGSRNNKEAYEEIKDEVVSGTVENKVVEEDIIETEETFVEDIAEYEEDFDYEEDEEDAEIGSCVELAFSLDGNDITLPCDLKTFTDLGWHVEDEEDATAVIEPGDTASIYFINDAYTYEMAEDWYINASIGLRIYNETDSDILYEDGIISGISFRADNTITSRLEKIPSLILKNGITIGSTDSDVEGAFDKTYLDDKYESDRGYTSYTYSSEDNHYVEIITEPELGVIEISIGEHMF